jgi:hypothetical protein
MYRLHMNHCAKPGALEHNFNEIGFQNPIEPAPLQKL